MPNIFSVLTSKIFGGLSLALLIVVGLLSWQNSRLADQRDDARTQAKAWKDAQAITRQSLDDVIAALDQKNAESLARAKALQDARSEAAQAQADAERRYATTKARIDAMRAAVGQNGDDCSVPEEVSDALAGL
jgi:hypothetical protein